MCEKVFSKSIILLSIVSTLDYGPVSEELMFEACETRKCVNISIVAHKNPKPFKAFEINLLKTPDLDPSIMLDPVQAQVRIPGGCLDGCDFRGLFE